VFLGGSGSGLAVNSPIAALLASHGFNVLSVDYIGDKGLPAKLSEVPLEYFERVFAWLANHALTRGKAVSILGQSKGAELSLLLASRYPIVKRLALFAPHAYCFQGIAFKNVSSWTYQGRPLPFIQLKNLWLFESMIGAFLRNQPFQFTTTYRKGLSAAKNKEAARIKVENAQADLLMFATGQNGMWNTDEGCAVIMDALRKANYPHQYDLVVHEGAGEPFPVPYVIPAGETTVRMGPRLALSVGGSVEANVHAQADFWARSIEFLKSKS